MSLLVWQRIAVAAGSDLRAYLEASTAADLPRDHVHLRTQELVLVTARRGGWTGRTEVAIDIDATRSRSADVILRRGGDLALVEIVDWIPDLGAEFRGWDRRLARVAEAAAADAPPAGAGARLVNGLWVLRQTRRNSRLVAEHAATFRARFPAPGRSWLGALTTGSAMPPDAGAVWVDVNGKALHEMRVGR